MADDTGPDPALLRDTVDHLAINRLQARYADVVTRRAWEELTELFVPEATVHLDVVTRDPFDITGPEALGRFIGDAVLRFDFFEFVILNAFVTLGSPGDPDGATGRMFMCEHRRTAETGSWDTAYGLYLDRYVRSDGRWWFAARSYRSLARRGAEDAVFGLPSTWPTS